MELICAYAPPLRLWQTALAGAAQPLAPRERTRTPIAGGLLLSLPIAGGSGAVKRTPPESWLLSGHGRWPHLHFEALRAAYGRTPYFAHLSPRLEPLYAAPPQEFREFVGRLEKEMLGFIQFEASWPRLMSLRASDPALYAALRGEKAAQADSDLSVLDALFRLGPEAIFLLAPPL